MIILPWPDKRLSSNARVHWAVKAKATKAAREAAGWAARASGVRVDTDGAITLKITFCPPDKRKRDIDGMLSSLKGAIDGIADGLAVNDCRFRYILGLGEPIKGGKVHIIVQTLEE